MQNLPDKGVSDSPHYLKADYTVTGLTGMVRESQRGSEENGRRFPLWDLYGGYGQLPELC
jgi:hypothetical protein